MTASVLQQLNELQEMDMSDLKETWKNYFETDPPKFNRSNIERKIAYRIQELAFSGLSNETRERIKQMSRNLSPNSAQRNKDLPPVGTILTREYKGIEHRVTILADGFEYQNMKYKNLSVIARTITGTRWSGPVFFGLKKGAK